MSRLPTEALLGHQNRYHRHSRLAFADSPAIVALSLDRPVFAVRINWQCYPGANSRFIQMFECGVCIQGGFPGFTQQE